MLTAEIQKENTIAYVTQSKTNFNFTYTKVSQSSLSVFLSGKNQITGLMTDIAMFDCFLYYLHDRSPIGKMQRQTKIWYNWEAFYCKVGLLF